MIGRGFPPKRICVKIVVRESGSNMNDVSSVRRASHAEPLDAVSQDQNPEFVTTYLAAVIGLAALFAVLMLFAVLILGSTPRA